MSGDRVCPDCGGAIPQDAPGGLCPRCLMRRAANTPTVSAASDTTPMQGGFEEVHDVLAVTESSGRYSILGEKGKGGMGRVLLVHDEHLDRDIALKELLPDLPGGSTPTPARHSKEMASRFLREAKITGQLEHPSITPVHELGRRADGTLYYTMKLIKGRTLSQAIKDAKNLNERLKLLPHFVDLCNAIAYAHSKGVIHRDIKPSNVMIGDYGETVVIDWGLAKVKDKKDERADEMQSTILALRDSKPGSGGVETEYGTALGTPAYMPPEQAQGCLDVVDERSDIYSLGAVLYEILTGSPVFSGKTVAHVLSQVLNDAPRPIRTVESKVDKRIAKICLNAIQKAPDDRYKSASQLAEAVQNWKPKNISTLRRVVDLIVLILFVGVPSTLYLLDRYYGHLLSNEIDKISASGEMLGLDTFHSPREDQVPSDSEQSSSFSVPGFLVSLHKTYPITLEEQYQNEVLAFSGPMLDPSKISDEQAFQMNLVLESHRDILRQVEYAISLPPASSQEIIRAITPEFGPGFLIPNILSSRCFANRFKLRAALLHREGDFDASLREITKILDFSLDIKDGPTLINAMIACAAANIAVTGIYKWVDDGSYSGDAVISIVAVLQRAKGREGFVLGFQGERSVGIQIFNQLNSGRAFFIDNSRGTWKDLSGSAIYGLPLFRFLGRRAEIGYLNLRANQIAAAALPYYQAAEERTSIERHSRQMTARFDLINPMFTSDFIGNYLVQAGTEARLDMASVAFELKGYRQEHGEYPERLDAFKPKYLERLPVDVFTGRPLVYRREGDLFALYSVGPNGIDENGAKYEGRTWQAPGVWSRRYESLGFMV